uniref:Uncharacterized protein n=2 Tax=Ovis TaxID=9935 RepID=A0AC11EV93_SHEEP
MTQQPVEQCDFQEKGWVKQCVGTVTLDLSNDQFDLNCNEFQSVGIRWPWPVWLGHRIRG